MTRLIRRRSMERLELYDLDKLATAPSTNCSLRASPLPPPRQTPQRRSSMNPAYERYKFLCNMSRSQTDPIYAATPMFTTIPQSSQDYSQRQLLGSSIRLENVRPLSPKMPKSPVPKTAEIIEEEKENEDERSEDFQLDNKNEDKENDNISIDSGSGDDNNDRDVVNDDDDDDADHKSIVEQIFNRDRENKD
ncbi:unnamed protein product [Adineta ricciae]|uniref:Uncharacterized protein n=1 Tax=Adineta ricciae TaxID=249248 RepID=A0A814I7D9_ADIRI|nr:unnamed protein product [Adineta ricciae]CAF1071053.1 unnamed protein product [Adineta ricciae]